MRLQVPPENFIYSMATTLERNKNRSRPKKSRGKKARRQREQKKRLIALGMDEKKVNQMSARDVLTALKHPKKVEAAAAAKDS